MHQTIKQLHTRFVAAVVVLLLVLSVVPAVRAASGDCGDGVTWDLTGGALTISGNGEMSDYSEQSLAPWYRYADEILSIKVENGVTSVGDFAFFQLKKVTAASVADSVTEIGSYAFYECEALQLLDLGSGVKTIGERAFKMCRSLMTLRLPDGLISIGDQSFYRCQSLMSVTVPASVTQMGTEAFMYCSNLANATILANLRELPAWTFYGCHKLRSVSLSSNISSVGLSAFEKCELLPESYDVADEPKNVDVMNTSSSTENGQLIVTQDHYTEQSGSSVNVQTTTQGIPGETIDTEVQVDAFLDEQAGWEQLEEKLQDVMEETDGENLEVNVHLKGEPVVSGQDVGRFSGQNVTISVHTQQGAHWHINGADIQADALKESYDLSFTLIPLTELDEAQKAAVGIGTSFKLVFNGDIDFKVEVELPLGISLARDTAVFFAPEEEAYVRKQAVVIDGEGIAHFYLGSVQAGTEYLIGINIPNVESEVSDAIIPDTLKNEYPEMEQVEEIEYVVTGVKSSWGMDIKQVTWILFGVMGGSILVVGIVIGTMNKVKLKKGYIPNLDDEEDIPTPRSPKKKKK